MELYPVVSGDVLTGYIVITYSGCSKGVESIPVDVIRGSRRRRVVGGSNALIQAAHDRLDVLTGLLHRFT